MEEIGKIITKSQEYDDIKNKQRFQFYCKNCNTLCSVQKRKERRQRQIRFLCSKCGIKKTNLLKYGTEFPQGISEISEKRKRTCLQRYGTEYPSQNEEVKHKIVETCIQKYGVCNPLQDEKIHQKQIDTLQRNYGVDNPSESDIIQERKSQSVKDKYNVEFLFQSDLVKEKIRQTNIKRYGVAYPSQNEEIKRRIENTNVERYGVTSTLLLEEVKELREESLIRKFGSISPFQNETYRKEFQAHHCITYDNICFDSSWEVIFYLFHKSLGHIVKREPCYFEYQYRDKTYKYYPDFEIEGVYYEVKGDYFFNERGELIDPYNDKNNEKALQKHNCIKEHNVVYVRNREIQEMKKLIKINYEKGVVVLIGDNNGTRERQSVSNS